MGSQNPVVPLADAAGIGRERLGSKAAALADLAAAGFPVPPGLVVTADVLDHPRLDYPRLEQALTDAADKLGDGPYAVRSSAVAEDLPNASFAGLYETYLGVDRAGLIDGVRRCAAAARADRVAVYRTARDRDVTADPGPGSSIAVLVQPMIDAEAAGVAFTANPLTGRRDETVVTAVRGLGERLVSGDAVGEEWIVHNGRAECTRPGEGALDTTQAAEVAELAARVAEHYEKPQDIEWAIDRTPDGRRLWLLQARPMTALPEPVQWTPPGPGLWMRNFRLGEWLPEAMTPLFADWLLHRIEAGYLDGMRATVGALVPFRYASVNGWYYNALPKPSPRLLARVITQSRGRALPFLFHALIQVSSNPVAADRAVLGGLEDRWRTQMLPSYRTLIDHEQSEVDTGTPDRLTRTVDRVGRAAGEYLWYLAVVGGSAWKIEAKLAAWCREHIPDTLADGSQVLLRGPPGAEPTLLPHSVYSIDWYHPTAAEKPARPADLPTPNRTRHTRPADDRAAAEQACRQALAGRRKLLAQFDALLAVAHRYAVIREQQARDLTLGWPLLRHCAHRLGEHLVAAGAIDQPDDVYFLTRAELHTTTGDHTETALRRRAEWNRQRRMAAPLTLGKPSRLTGDPIERAVNASRGTSTIPEGALLGHPASAGRATGRVHIIDGPDDFPTFADGEVLVAKATAPAWTPLFARAAAIVTDGGNLAAHASLVAREYAIPAVVGTGDATRRLHTGQLVTVDGTAGTVQTHLESQR